MKNLVVKPKPITKQNFKKLNPIKPDVPVNNIIFLVKFITFLNNCYIHNYHKILCYF